MAAIVILFTSAFSDVASPALHAANDELRAYLIEAGDSHPGLHARYAEWQAALQRIPQARGLDDPMFTYGQFLQSDVNRFNLGLKQKFPWFGTLRKQGDKAAAEAEAALMRFYGQRDGVFAAVKRTYFDYAFLAANIEAAQSELEILDYLEEVVRSKYALGMTSQDDLLRVQIETAKTKDFLDGLIASRPALSAQLAEAIGREPGEPLAWPSEAALPTEWPSVEEVAATLDEANPKLLEFEHVIESRLRQVELARKRRFPDFTLGIEYASLSAPRQIRPDRPYPASLNAGRRAFNVLTGAAPFDAVNGAIDAYALATSDEPMSYRDGGRDNVMASISVNVPIWRKKIKGAIAEAELMAAAAEHERHRKRLELERTARMALFEIEDALRRHRLYETTLIPTAQQTYEGVLSGYATGLAESGFLDVMQSVRVLLDFDIERARAERDLQVGVANLELLMGAAWGGESADTDAQREPAAVAR